MTSSSQPDAEVVTDLRSRLLSELRAILGHHQEYDAVDYPDHFNVGDSAIWLGQARALREVGLTEQSVSTRRTYHPRALRADGPIIIQGGGNFGGLYQTHHQLRLRVLGDFRGRPVVQMPQSIEYADDDRRDELRRAVDRHGATTLLVRDARSLERARADFDCPVVLTPDAAFGLGALSRSPGGVGVTVQARTDKEASGAAPAAGDHIFDWLDPGSDEPRAAAGRRLARLGRVGRRSRLTAYRRRYARLAHDLAEANLAYGREALSSGALLVTDRLHGHVLACLLGQPHLVVNDRYGKIAAFHETWTHRFRVGRLVPTWTEVEDAVRAHQAAPVDGSGSA